MGMNRQRGTWIQLRCGDRVHDKADPRFIGRVVAIAHGYEATVCWEDSSHLSHVPMSDLLRVQPTVIPFRRDR